MNESGRELGELSTKLLETEQALATARTDVERRGRAEATTQQQLNQALKQISQLEPKVASLQSEVSLSRDCYSVENALGVAELMTPTAADSPTGVCGRATRQH